MNTVSLRINELYGHEEREVWAGTVPVSNRVEGGLRTAELPARADLRPDSKHPTVLIVRVDSVNFEDSSKLYVVLHTDATLGTPSWHVYRYPDDEAFIRAGVVGPGDRVDVYAVPVEPRRFLVEAAYAPVKLVAQ